MRYIPKWWQKLTNIDEWAKSLRDQNAEGYSAESQVVTEKSSSVVTERSSAFERG
jgi:hypothetical protein